MSQLLEERVERHKDGHNPQEEGRPATVESHRTLFLQDLGKAVHWILVDHSHLRSCLVARHQEVRRGREGSREERGHDGAQQMQRRPVFHELASLRQRRLGAVVAKRLPRAEEPTSDDQRPSAPEQGWHASLRPNAAQLPDKSWGRSGSLGIQQAGHLQTRFRLEEGA
eukprot:CAMPEP_0115162482 /NCGR_PEP_ID=MMETSP0227-20121206/71983_1 /TAXON_ID=89957 /ORGANISM="Polarella glacialis, Strain CCMP 1383" /LENGTH=167 /DNA_ID=CAMNT_0002574691 /DNA_START=129 /DNA_END=632 /DNA_ORIENTATION=-